MASGTECWLFRKQYCDPSSITAAGRLLRHIRGWLETRRALAHFPVTLTSPFLLSSLSCKSSVDYLLLFILFLSCFAADADAGVATMQIKIAFLCSVSSACLNVWRCVATSFSWLYVLLLCYHAFAIVVVVKNKKKEWMKIILDFFFEFWAKILSLVFS